MKDWKADSLFTKLWAFQRNMDMLLVSQQLVDGLFTEEALGVTIALQEVVDEELNGGLLRPEATSDTRG